ncbi:MAG: hypothetical protein AMS27_01085 [Bacteroides sp. SM23_62_1]|nr:MAG: hypothetical protein AMS27_01085 [Bacteroides sp. SM23_62_1]
MNRRIKKINYNYRHDFNLVFSAFRGRFLDKYYHESEKAEWLFKRDLRRLSANFSILFFFQYSLFSKYWFHKKIYQSIILSGEDDNFEKLVQKASLDGALLYLPNHQAHIDSLIISWIANFLRVPQPLFYAWNTLARRRSAYLMPLVNACLLDRQVMDERFKCADPFRNTRQYRYGYTILIEEYLRHMLTRGVDTLIYPEGGRSYNGIIGEARIRRIFKDTLKVQEGLGNQKIISIIPISITYTLVPEADKLIASFHSGQVIPPSSLFHDLTDADNLYRSFRPTYQTRTNYSLVKDFVQKRIPIYCVLGNPISLLNKEVTLDNSFNIVKRNLKILPHHFFARLLLNDPSGMVKKVRTGGINALLEPAKIFRNSLQKFNLDEAYYDDGGLVDILSIGLEFFRYGGHITGEAVIRDGGVLEYYANKIN